MASFTALIIFTMGTLGLTVIIVWPQDGPIASLRENWLRHWLPRNLQPALDCYLCTSFWVGLALSPLVKLLLNEPWWPFGCLIGPALFWLLLIWPAVNQNEQDIEDTQ